MPKGSIAQTCQRARGKKDQAIEGKWSCKYGVGTFHYPRDLFFANGPAGLRSNCSEGSGHGDCCQTAEEAPSNCGECVCTYGVHYGVLRTSGESLSTSGTKQKTFLWLPVLTLPTVAHPSHIQRLAVSRLRLKLPDWESRSGAARGWWIMSSHKFWAGLSPSSPLSNLKHASEIAQLAGQGSTQTLLPAQLSFSWRQRQPAHEQHNC